MIPFIDGDCSIIWRIFIANVIYSKSFFNANKVYFYFIIVIYLIFYVFACEYFFSYTDFCPDP